MNFMLISSVVIVALASSEALCETPGVTIIDLTHPFDEITQAYPGLKPFGLKLTNRGITEAGYWLQTEDYEGATHVGTHMDAPCHIVRGQWTLEDIPLDRLFMVPAAIVDISDRAKLDRDTNLEVEDLTEWEKRTGVSLNGTVVLVNTGWSGKWKSKRRFLGTDSDDVSKIHFPGISQSAAEWLAQHRTVYGVGIDTTSLDNGQATQRRAHEALFRANIYGLENVNMTHKLPKYGAKLLVSPMRIRKACGAPVRVIAQVPEDRCLVV